MRRHEVLQCAGSGEGERPTVVAHVDNGDFTTLRPREQDLGERDCGEALGDHGCWRDKG